MGYGPRARLSPAVGLLTLASGLAYFFEYINFSGMLNGDDSL